MIDLNNRKLAIRFTEQFEGAAKELQKTIRLIQEIKSTNNPFVKNEQPHRGTKSQDFENSLTKEERKKILKKLLTETNELKGELEDFDILKQA